VNTPKAFGKSIKASQLGEGIAKFFPLGLAATESSGIPGSTSGLPRETLLPVLRAIREEVQEIRNIYATLEIRMVGGSLLIIYEADWKRVEEGLKKWYTESDEMEQDDEEDEEEEEDDKAKVGPAFTVKLIDFAHTLLVPGKGPDDGVLKGMDTVLKLLDSRIEELTVA